MEYIDDTDCWVWGIKNMSIFSRRRTSEVPIWEKSYLTLEEAASYSGIGREKLRHISDKEDCPFVLWNGTKRLIKRRKLDEYCGYSRHFNNYNASN